MDEEKIETTTVVTHERVGGPEYPAPAMRRFRGTVLGVFDFDAPDEDAAYEMFDAAQEDGVDGLLDDDRFSLVSDGIDVVSATAGDGDWFLEPLKEIQLIEAYARQARTSLERELVRALAMSAVVIGSDTRVERAESAMKLLAESMGQTIAQTRDQRDTLYAALKTLFDGVFDGDGVSHPIAVASDDVRRAREALTGAVSEDVRRTRDDRDAAVRDRERFWGILCDTAEALGCTVPEAAPHVAGWAAKMRVERDAAREAVKTARRDALSAAVTHFWGRALTLDALLVYGESLGEQGPGAISREEREVLITSHAVQAAHKKLRAIRFSDESTAEERLAYTDAHRELLNARDERDRAVSLLPVPT